jgi:hypothetical protein
MNIAPPQGSRISAAVALVPATLAVMLACWSLNSGVGPGSTAPADPVSGTVASAPGYAAGAGRVVLRVPDGSATVTLDDTPTARAFAAMLPLRLTLHDPMGQAKSGQLPDRIDVTGASSAIDPTIGVVYYWPPSGDLAIFYDDLGQAVPSPGLVRLGVVDSGLTSISAAGNQFPVRVEPADRPVTPMGS